MIKKLSFFVLSLLLTANVWASGSDQVPPMPKELQGKTIQYIIAQAPGANTDINQRYMMEQVARLTGLKLVPINKPGANSVIAARDVINAPADGLTIYADANGTHVLNPVVKPEGWLDPNLLTPVAIHYFSPQFIFVNAQSNIHSLKDLVEAAKKDPNFNAAYVVQHSLLLQREFFSQLGANPVMVPYQKSAQLPLAIQTGEITTFLSSGNDNEPFVKAGKMRAIGTSWDHKLSIFPDAQPMSDLVPGFKSSNQQLIAVHRDTPKHIKEYYNKVFRIAAKTEESRQRWKDFSVVPGFNLDLTGVDTAIKRERDAIQNMADRASKTK